MPEDAQSMVNDFGNKLNDLAVGSAFTDVGLDHFIRWIAEQPRTRDNPDPKVYIGPDPPGEEGSLVVGAWPFSRITVDCAPKGEVRVRLAQQWLVTVHALWEEEYRERIAKALGGTKDQLLVPLFGDINKMRNDIIHHAGIATRHNTGRCELLRWFRRNEALAIETQHINEFTRLFRVTPFNLEVPPESADS